jgi:hypothetical protein
MEEFLKLGVRSGLVVAPGHDERGHGIVTAPGRQ